MSFSIKQLVSANQRRIRTEKFISFFDLSAGDHILDIGGHPDYWKHCPIPFKISIVNLPGIIPNGTDTGIHTIEIFEGDVTTSLNDVSGVKVLFCNSVFEHLASAEKRLRAAENILRLGLPYWVQIPAPSFPVEAHCSVPFWWSLPDAVQQYFLDRWKRKQLHFLVDQMQTTNPVNLAEMCRLFPDAQIYSEKLFGFRKSVSVYKV